MVLQRDQYPKEALSPDRLSDIDQVMADAVEMKFLDAPLSKRSSRSAGFHRRVRDAVEPAVLALDETT